MQLDSVKGRLGSRNMLEKSDKQSEKAVDDEIPSHGKGIRYLQMAATASVLIVLLFARSTMAVAVLAMTDRGRANQTEVYSWDKKTQGVILSSFYWGYVVMQIPSGLLAKRFGGKPILLAAVLVNAVLCLLLPTLARLGDWVLVCIVRLLMGALQASLFPSCHMLFGRWLPAHERTTFSGLVYGAANMGMILAMPAAGLLAESRFGWPSIFYTSAGVLLAVAAFWWWLAASTPAEHRWVGEAEFAYIVKGRTESGPNNTLRTPWKDIFKCRGFWAIGFAHFASASCFILFLVDLPTYLEKGLKISLKDSSFLSALPYVGLMLGSMVSTRACDFLVNNKYLSLINSRRLFNGIGQLGPGFCLISLTFVIEQHKPIAVALLITALTLYSFTSAGWMINHLDLSPNYAGVLLSITNAAANFGSVLTPIVVSFILRNDPTDISRWRVVFSVVATLVTITTVLYAALCDVTHKPWDEPGYMDQKDAHPEETEPALQSELTEKNHETAKIKNESLNS